MLKLPIFQKNKYQIPQNAAPSPKTKQVTEPSDTVSQVSEVSQPSRSTKKKADF